MKHTLSTLYMRRSLFKHFVASLRKPVHIFIGHSEEAKRMMAGEYAIFIIIA